MVTFEAKYRPFIRYGFAVVSVGLALLITLVLPQSFSANAVILFFLAVILSAWYGNFGTGMLTAVLAVMVMKHYGFYPTNTTDFLRSDITRLATSMFVVVGITVIQARHRRTVSALRRSRDQLEIILRDMANGVVVQDRSGKVTYANYEAARLMGYVSSEAMLQASRDDLLKDFELFDEQGEPFPPSSLPGRLALLGMRYPETVLRYRSENSRREHWVYDKARPIFDEAGQVQASVSLFLDVTELKQAQQALADQREQMRVTLHSIGDAVVATDAAGSVTFLNPVAAALLGYAEQAALGQLLAALFYLVEEETRQPLPNPVEQVLQSGSLIKLKENTALVARDGAERPIEASAAPIRDAQGRLIGSVLVLRDITQRKLAQAMLRVRVRQQEMVARLGLRALEGIDLDTLILEAVDALAQTLHTEYSKVLELLPSGDGLLLRAGNGWEAGLVGQAILETGKDSQGGFTLLTNEPVIVEDLRTEQRFNAPTLLMSHGVISGMSVIIGGEKRPWGVLGAHTTRKRIFTQDDVNFLQAIANLLASAISQNQVRQAEHEERVFAEALRDTAEALNGTLDLAQVLDRVLENIGRVVPHDAADIMLIEGDAARVVRYRGYAEGEMLITLREMRLALAGTPTLRQMIETGQPLIIDDTRDYPGWVQIPNMEWLRSYAAVPLAAQGKVKGFLNVTSVQPNAFSKEQGKRLQAFAAQATAAIQNAQLYGEVLQRADENTLRDLSQELRRQIQ